MGKYLLLIFNYIKIIIFRILLRRNIEADIRCLLSKNTLLLTYGKSSVIKLGRSVRSFRNCKLSAVNGELIIGKNVFFNSGAIIVCREKITIGDNCKFGPNVVIYDHDHTFRKSDISESKDFNTSPIFIGENTWVGSNVIILRGSNIGKNCVVAAGTIVRGNIPDNSIVKSKNELVITPIES